MDGVESVSGPTINPMQPGTLLADRYELVSHIARGGMADVWEATDRLLGRQVAVKVLHPQFATDETFVTRFRREASSAANLSHPNIVSIFDWGEEGSTYFIVMELVTGKTLRDIIREDTGILPRRAAEIAAEVSAALAVAHRAGLVHRDLKPANILLATDGTAKVTDFGIAVAWNDSQQLTRTGAVIGTATYFSPEQAQGQQIDERSDLYSLGVVLYEMLTGVPPFTGDSPVSVAYQHVSEPAQLPSMGNPDIPPDLETVVIKAMDKLPDHRYQTALEMREDLLLYIQGGRPVSASAVSPQDATVLLSEMPAPTVPPEETYRQVAASGPAANRPFMVTAGILVLTLVSLVYLLSRVIIGGTETTAEPVLVPDVVGMSETAASDTIQELDLKFRPVRTTHPTVEAGFVISTNPAADAEVDSGSFVEVVISSGLETAQVPVLIGIDQVDAAERLTERGLVLGVVTMQTDPEVPAGEVIAQDPESGVTVDGGSSVSIVISAGPEMYVLEDLNGRTLREVQIELEDAGFIVEVEEVFDEELVEGTILSSIPGPGEIETGGTILLIVSIGPETVAIPSLIGRTIEDAQRVAAEFGFTIVISDSTIENADLAGKIIEQSPDAGDLQVPGAEIVVVLAVAPATTTTTSTTTTTTSSTTTTTTTPTTTTTTTVPEG